MGTYLHNDIIMGGVRNKPAARSPNREHIARLEYGYSNILKYKTKKGKKCNDHVAFEDCSVKQLRTICKMLKEHDCDSGYVQTCVFTGYSRMKKNELIDAIKEHNKLLDDIISY